MAKLSRFKRAHLRALLFASNLRPGAVVFLLVTCIAAGLALALGAIR